MAHRTILTKRQRADLFDLPTDESSLLQHYTLADDDIEYIHERRRPENRIGFALQLFALRYPGRILLQGEALLSYEARRQTRQQHLEAFRNIYGYKMFSGRVARDLKVWLLNEAEVAQSKEDLAWRLVKRCRGAQIILPGISVIERLCADALVTAERRVATRIVEHLPDMLKDQLDDLLAETVGDRVSQFVWLRQFEGGKNTADIIRLLDRLEVLQGIELPLDALDDVPPHQITRLRRQGERYFTDGLLGIPSDRWLAILTVCAVEWRSAIADAVVGTHDRIVGKIWRDASRLCDAQITASKVSLQDTLRSFKKLGASLFEAKGDDAPLDPAVVTACGWHRLEGLVATAAQFK